VYCSKFNKETLQTLTVEFSLPDFMAHKEFCEMFESLDQEALELREKQAKK